MRWSGRRNGVRGDHLGDREMGTFRVQTQCFLWKHISIGLDGVHDIAFQSVKSQFTTAVNIVQIH